MKKFLLSVLSSLVVFAASFSGHALAATAAGGPLNGTWGCTVPATYVYSAVRANGNCAGGIEYKAILPADGIWSCKLPTMWAYDTFDDESLQPGHGPCQLGSQRGDSFHFVKPATGRWVCQLPVNNIWAYAGVSHDTSTTACRLGGGVTQLKLLAPATGVWACNTPTGYVAAQRKLTSSPSPCLGSFLYLLQKS